MTEAKRSAEDILRNVIDFFPEEIGSMPQTI
jgi:hypothetical protein